MRGLLLAVAAAGCAREVGAESFQAPRPPAEEVEPPLDRTGWPEVVRWGFVPYLPEPVLRSEFGRLARRLGERLAVRFEIVVTRDYEALRRRLRAAEVDFAQLAPLNYVRARAEMPDLRLLATQIADGSPTYQGYVVVRADSGLERLEDLAGLRVCWVDPESSSGYLYPRALLRKRGFDPDRFLASPPIFSGNHAAAMDTLLAGGCDVAAVYSGAVREAWSRGVDRAALRIVAKTERIPYDAYCLRPGLPESLATALRRELLAVSTRTGEGRAVLGRILHINGFMIAFDDAYDGVRRMERFLGGPEGGRPRPDVDGPRQ